MLVRDAMTSAPITVLDTTTLPDVARIFDEKHIRRAPVLNASGKLVGIVSDHDVMTTMPSPATTLSRWEMNSLLEKLPVKDFMTSRVWVTPSDCPIEEVARFLLDKKIGALPVVDDGELIGIITESDIFRTFVAMLSGGKKPGLRFVLRVEEGRGILASLGSIINDNGGSIISIATLDEGDGVHKRLMVKEEGANGAAVRSALVAADFEVLEVRERGQCTITTVGK